MKNSKDEGIPQGGDDPSRRSTSGRRLDPVCGMLVQPDSPHRTAYEGEDFFFCSSHCLETFQREPARYLEGAKPHGTI